MLRVWCLQIGSHVHSIVGASRFKDVYDADDLMQSKCTTIPVQPDKSNYWAVRILPFALEAGRACAAFAQSEHER